MATQFGYTNLALGATETTETDIGDITVPKGASRITGICGAVALETGTAADGGVAWGHLEFTGAEDLDGIPAAVVCMEELGGSYTPRFIPCNIPVKEDATIACGMTMSVAQGGTCHGLMCLRFE